MFDGWICFVLFLVSFRVEEEKEEEEEESFFLFSRFDLFPRLVEPESEEKCFERRFSWFSFAFRRSKIPRKISFRKKFFRRKIYLGRIFRRRDSSKSGRKCAANRRNICSTSRSAFGFELGKASIQRELCSRRRSTTEFSTVFNSAETRRISFAFFFISTARPNSFWRRTKTNRPFSTTEIGTEFSSTGSTENSDFRSTKIRKFPRIFRRAGIFCRTFSLAPNSIFFRTADFPARSATFVSLRREKKKTFLRFVFRSKFSAKNVASRCAKKIFTGPNFCAKTKRSSSKVRRGRSFFCSKRKFSSDKFRFDFVRPRKVFFFFNSKIFPPKKFFAPKSKKIYSKFLSPIDKTAKTNFFSTQRNEIVKKILSKSFSSSRIESKFFSTRKSSTKLFSNRFDSQNFNSPKFTTPKKIFSVRCATLNSTKNRSFKSTIFDPKNGRLTTFVRFLNGKVSFRLFLFVVTCSRDARTARYTNPRRFVQLEGGWTRHSLPSTR